MPAAARPHLPAYALYGEADRSPAADPLHCESIATRSRLHDWEIRPHRHEALCQLLWVARGRAEARFDGETQALNGPGLVLVPPLAAHGFRFSPQVDGLVFTVDEHHWRALLGDASELAAVLQTARAWRLRRGSDAARQVAAAAEALHDELQGHARWRGAAIDAALLRLLVAVARALPAAPRAPGARPERALAHVQRYRAEIELHYRSQPALATLAARLNLTTTQLNRVCRQVLGHSALGVLHARLVLEAQRDLAYTSMSVKQIAFALGFSDAAYFTRFFRRRTGRSPTAWRQTRSSSSAMP